MKTKNNRKTQRFLNLLLVLALLVPMLACGDSDKPKVDRSTPETKLTEEKPSPKDTPASTPIDPLEAIYGSWEVVKGGQTGVEKWNFKRATKKDGDYVGKVTDKDNIDIFNYTIKPQPNSSNSGTIGLEELTPYAVNLTGKTLDYEISDNGNKITLKDNPEIVLLKGTANTDVIKDAETMADLSKSNWKLNDGREVFFVFDKSAAQYDSGYAGMMQINNPNGAIEEKQFVITSKNKVTIKDNMGSRAATYDLAKSGDDLKITFDKSGEELFLSRR